MERILFKYIVSRLHQTWALIAGLILSMVLFATLDGFIGNFCSINTRCLIYILLISIWVCYWTSFKWRLPRNNKNKIGVVIAIYTENESERIKLKNDFLIKLKKDFLNSNLQESIKLIFLKNHFSEKIKDSDNWQSHIKKINSKIKAHFYICGEIKKRKHGKPDEENYFFHLKGLVSHAPISHRVSQSIGQDFSKVLPTTISFSDVW